MLRKKGGGWKKAARLRAKENSCQSLKVENRKKRATELSENDRECRVQRKQIVQRVQRAVFDGAREALSARSFFSSALSFGLPLLSS